MREDAVRVKAKQDGGAMSYASWHHRLVLKPGDVADKWQNGSPITKGEFEALLKPHGFELVEEVQTSAVAPAAKGGK
jgi:hypothetical protein